MCVFKSLRALCWCQIEIGCGSIFNLMYIPLRNCILGLLFFTNILLIYHHYQHLMIYIYYILFPAMVASDNVSIIIIPDSVSMIILYAKLYKITTYTASVTYNISDWVGDANRSKLWSIYFDQHRLVLMYTIRNQ